MNWIVNTATDGTLIVTKKKMWDIAQHIEHVEHLTSFSSLIRGAD